MTGDAVNVAARLEAAASPGEIYLGADTYELIRNEVTVEAVEPLSLKGKAEPVAAWRLRAVTGTVGRRARPLEAPLVGRRRPLRLLDDAFREAVEERVCHLFTILGTAGVGKSRLVEEFIGSVGDQAQVAEGRVPGLRPWDHLLAGGRSHSARSGNRRVRSVGAVVARLQELLGPGRSGTHLGGRWLAARCRRHPGPEEMFWAIRKTFEAIARQRPRSSSSMTCTGASPPSST